jgi:diketogulonate reductase-like aldo/keto reductase
MDIPEKTLKSGFHMPEFGIGTWQMGGRLERNPANDDVADMQSIRAAIELGVTHIDTAEQYAAGYTEELLGKALIGYDRSKLFIISKVMATNMRYEDVLAACDGSLRRVGTDYFDMYLLHRYVPEVPMEETMRAMDKLLAEGMIRNIGVANYGVEAFKKAQEATKNKIVYNQVHYNLEVRAPERTKLLEYCQENDVLLAAWRPVQKGALLANPPQILLDVAEKYQKTPAQVAINWLLSQKNVITLAKTSNVEHLRENLGAIGWEMEQGDIERLRLEYPNQKDSSDAVPLG